MRVPEYGENTPEGWTNQQKNGSTPIPGGTPEHAKNAREWFTNYTETQVFQYLMEVPEYWGNTPEG